MSDCLAYHANGSINTSDDMGQVSNPGHSFNEATVDNLLSPASPTAAAVVTPTVVTPAISIPTLQGEATVKSVMSIDNLLAPAGPTAAAVVTPAVVTPALHGHDETQVPATDAVSPSSASSLSSAVMDDSDDYQEHLHPHPDPSDKAVGGDPANREFICLNDEYSECHTGQYILTLSRKTISNHFGRNKSCTRAINDWPLFCRKHYQRATYKPDLWQLRKVNLILRQFDIIEKLYPGTMYTVALKRAEEDRLNNFARKVAEGISVDQAAAAVAPDSKTKAFQAPIDVLRELGYHLGAHKTIDEVKEAVNLILDMLRKKETAQVPSIEFLPNIPHKASKGVKAKDVKKAPKSKAARKTAKGRVSAKGAVQKAGKN